MKHVLLVLASVLVLTSCQKKIGYIDNVKVINDYQEKLDIEEKFKKMDESFKKKVDSLGKSFQERAASVEKEAKRLSKSKKQAKYEELNRIQQRLQQQLQFEQQKLQGDFQKEMDSVITKVKDYVKDYGKTNGYDYILGTSDASVSVVYGKEENDLTETILKSLNDSYKK